MKKRPYTAVFFSNKNSLALLALKNLRYRPKIHVQKIFRICKDVDQPCRR